jgi:uncharacterized protein with PIN domain
MDTKPTEQPKQEKCKYCSKPIETPVRATIYRNGNQYDETFCCPRCAHGAQCSAEG